MTKPTVFNYKNHEELRQAYKELLADNQHLIADNRKLRKEVTELKQLNDGYVKIIAKNQETNNKLMATLKHKPHGKWIHTTWDGKYDAWRCSECGSEFLYLVADNYCGECGARMKGGEE